MQFGHFDDIRREYVITRPDTPLPWLNYLGDDDFFSLCSNTAGGYAFYRDARLRRLIRYRYNSAPLDVGGRFLYLRDDESGDWWNPGWAPSHRELDGYECRHGLGYTLISGARGGIRAETTYLVPPGQTLEAWQVRVTNERAAPARVSLVGAVEFCLWDAQDDATNYQRNYSTGEVLVEDGAVYHVTEYRERRDHFAWLACTESVAGFDTSRDAFLGPYRGWEAPAALDRGVLAGSIAHGWQPIGALQVALELAAGESREVTFLLGYTENPAGAKFDPPGSGRPATVAARDVVARYRQPGRIEADLAALRSAWDERLGAIRVSTGNEHLDRMVNIWNPYQCVATFNLSRSASLFEAGIGRGMGFRDSNQDLLGFVHMLPERARDRILDIAATQLPDGSAYHQYQPLTKRGNDDIGSGFNDDPAWLVLGVAAYLKETGDRSILEEPVAWDTVAGSETPLHDHLRRSIDFTLARLGPHALPLIGRADWNDCLNLNVFSEQPGTSFQTAPQRQGGVAESLFIAALFVVAAREAAAIARLRDDAAEAARLDAAAASMTCAIEAHGWDGAWYLRAYDHAGQPVGSSACEEGQIFIEPQGWMAMAGVGLEDGRTRMALASVRERLATAHGIVLQQPAFRSYHVELGEISSYPPGYKENAGVFCHTNPWLMIGEAILGNAEGALDYYLRINPSAREAISEVHRCEPYVYAQMIAGRDAPTHGEAKNSWLTGTAAWNLVAATQWILGIRPEHDGLRVAPVIPASWPGFTAWRRFRGTEYEIRVTRGAGDGAELMVDGVPVAGTLVPLPPAGTARVSVEVRLA
ncbi:MAG: GH36-type glycosyl hydrolase domain-containing protein [Candidatus Limnocylindrales bacterium]